MGIVNRNSQGKRLNIHGIPGFPNGVADANPSVTYQKNK